MKEYIEMLRRQRIEDLRETASVLRDQLVMVLAHIDSNGECGEFNGLGTVQAQGGKIDRLMGEITTLRDILRRTIP